MSRPTVRYLVPLGKLIEQPNAEEESDSVVPEAIRVANGTDPGMLNRGQQWRELNRNLDRATETLHLVVQPLFVAKTRECFANEALARTQTSAFPHPGALFDAAELAGRLQGLGREIRRLAAQRFRDGYQGVMFVNLHPADLLDPELFEPTNELAQYAPRVILEVTERASVSGMNHITRRLHKLRALGYRVAIDDLGAGYSHLGQFGASKPDFVKLDMSLIRNIQEEMPKQQRVLEIIQWSNSHGVAVVAEGIETQEELECVEKLGVHYLQGYFLGRPQ